MRKVRNGHRCGGPGEEKTRDLFLTRVMSYMLWLQGSPPRPDRLGRRNGNKPHDLLWQREEEKKKIFQSR